MIIEVQGEVYGFFITKSVLGTFRRVPLWYKTIDGGIKLGLGHRGVRVRSRIKYDKQNYRRYRFYFWISIHSFRA